MKKILATVLVLVFVFALFPVGVISASAEDAKPSLEGWKIGSIDMSGFGYPFYVATQNMLVDLCETTGVELVTTTLAGYDDAAFMAAYEYLIDQGANLIGLSTFSEGTISLLADLMEENGVYWFLANRQISDPDLKEKVFSMEHFIGNDYCDEEGNAYDLVKQLHDEYDVKNLAVIGLTQGDLNGDLRDKGIARACEDCGINLLTETRGITTVDDVTNAVEGIIASYPEVDSIFIVGGLITNGALAGAAQALANHNLTDKVSIALIDISTGMSEYMGEGQPLKLVAGGNLVMDMVFSSTCLVNHALGISVDKEPFVISTHMMTIRNAEDADDYDEYVESMEIPMISGNVWYETIVGKTLEEVQAFSDNFSIEFAKSLRG